MKTFLPILAAVTATALCACVEPHVRSTQPASFASEAPDRPGVLNIVSDPPGAVIQVNGRSVGHAPCTAEIPVLENNHEWILRQNLTVTALPEDVKQHLQTKFFERLSAPPKQVAFEFLDKPGKSARGKQDEEEFSTEWDRITGGRSHEISHVH